MVLYRIYSNYIYNTIIAKYVIFYYYQIYLLCSHFPNCLINAFCFMVYCLNQDHNKGNALPQIENAPKFSFTVPLSFIPLCNVSVDTTRSFTLQTFPVWILLLAPLSCPSTYLSVPVFPVNVAKSKSLHNSGLHPDKDHGTPPPYGNVSISTLISKNQSLRRVHILEKTDIYFFSPFPLNWHSQILWDLLSLYL